jgi:hypothetical protein
MSRPPQYDISLDLLERPSSLEDYTAGDAAIVRTIEARQHALVCGWGTPPQVVTLHYAANGGAYDLPVLIRVPPYCTRMRVASLRWGSLVYELRVGALPPTFILLGTDSLDPERARWNEGTTAEGTIGSETQSLQVLGSPASSWSTVVARLNVIAFNGQLLALAFYPVLEQAV